MYNIPNPPIYKTSKLLKKYKFCVIDVETTGVDPLNDRITSIACRNVVNGVVDKNPFYSLVDPEMAIPPSASAVNGISNYSLKLAGAKPLDHIIDNIANYIGDSFPVAHNAQFDRAFVNPSILLENGYTRSRWVESEEDLEWRKQFNSKGRAWLCTYRLAHHLFKAHYGYTDISLNNEALRYWLEPKYIRKSDAHNALVDVNTTIHNLMHLLSYAEQHLNVTTIEELFDIQNQALAVHEIPFGKHRGELIENVPSDYLEWTLANPEKIGNEGLSYELGLTLANELKRRKKINIFVNDVDSGNTLVRGNLFSPTKVVPDNMTDIKANSTIPPAHLSVKERIKAVTAKPNQNKSKPTSFKMI